MKYRIGQKIKYLGFKGAVIQSYGNRALFDYAIVYLRDNGERITKDVLTNEIEPITLKEFWTT
jgi:hypothetical protein